MQPAAFLSNLCFDFWALCFGLSTISTRLDFSAKVFAGDRSHEHALKLAGATYEDVHAAGGGIGFTVQATRAASEAQLLASTLQRLDAMLRGGTTSCEIKTGYGLDWATELKMLRVANRAAAAHRMDVKTTFLVHAVPQGWCSEEVARAVCIKQLPELRRLVDRGDVSCDFVDVFCERGFFSPDDTRRVLTAAQALGFGTCFHGDELTDLGCGELAAELGVKSVSHLEMLSAAGVVALARAGVHAQLLPTTAHLLRLPSPPARALIDAGAPVCLATDFNPNAHSLDVPTAMGLACVHFKLSMAEALVAATQNAASALGMAASHGSLEVGKQGDCVLLDAPSWEHVVYQMRAPVADVFKGGISVHFEGTRRPSAPTLASTPKPAAMPGLKKGDSAYVDLSSLALGLPPTLPPKSFAALDQSVPHAPGRPVTLTPALRRRALANALR
jgi:imidazolonepropionase